MFPNRKSAPVVVSEITRSRGRRRGSVLPAEVGNRGGIAKAISVDLVGIARQSPNINRADIPRRDSGGELWPRMGMEAKELFAQLYRYPGAERANGFILLPRVELAAWFAQMSGAAPCDVPRLIEACAFAVDAKCVSDAWHFPSKLKSLPEFDVLKPMPALGHAPSRTLVGRWLIEATNPTSTAALSPMTAAFESFERWRLRQNLGARTPRGFSASLRTRYNILGDEVKFIVGVKLLAEDLAETDQW